MIKELSTDATKRGTPSLPSTGERLLTEFKNQDTVEHLHRYYVACGYAKGKDVLDIASGEGYGSNLLASHARSVVGVDISADAIAHARTKYLRNNLSYKVGDASSIPLPDNSVDLVVSFETLEHHDKHREMLSEVKRVLRPQGLLIMSTPDKRTYSDLPAYSNPYHTKELYIEQFESLMKDFFRYVDLLSQCCRFGSVISPQKKTAAGFQSFSGDFQDFYIGPIVRDARYVIGVASDTEIPDPSASFHDGTELLVAATSEDFIQRILKLEANVESKVKQLQNIENSLSYKLGRAFTAPLRWLLASQERALTSDKHMK